MQDPDSDRLPVPARSSADLTSVLIELLRLVRAVGFYEADDPVRRDVLEGACLAIRADIDRNGPIDLGVARGTFRETSVDEPITAGTLVELATAMEERGVNRLHVGVHFGRDAVEGFAGFLAAPATRAARQGDLDAWSRLGVVVGHRSALEVPAEANPPATAEQPVEPARANRPPAPLSDGDDDATAPNLETSTPHFDELDAQDAYLAAPAPTSPAPPPELPEYDLLEEELLSFDSPLPPSGGEEATAPILEPPIDPLVDEAPLVSVDPNASAPSQPNDDAKPTIEDDPIGAPGDPRGEALCAGLQALEASLGDEQRYLESCAAVLGQVRPLAAEGVLVEAYRAAVLLCRHAGGGGAGSPVLPELADAARSALAELCQREMLTFAIERACSRDSRVAVRAGQVLIQTGAQSVPAILSHLRAGAHPEAAAQLAAVVVATGEDAVEPLRAELESAGTRPARMALQLAAELQNPKLVPALIPALHGGNAAIRNDACRALVAIGGSAHEIFVDALRAGPPELARAAARALGEIGHRRAVRPLTEALEASLGARQDIVARETLSALAKLGEPRAVPIMTRVAEKRDWIRLGERGRERETTRRAAVTALEALGGKAAEAALRKIANEGDASLAPAAQEALDRLADPDLADPSKR